MIKKWKIGDIPDLSGKIAIVTGGNKGLGFRCAKELARKHAKVIIGCRNVERGSEAKEEILKEIPNGDIDVLQLDLLNHGIIQKFAEDFMWKYKKLDILLNNAGVVNLEKLTRTKDGKEMHMATNHLGHFLLTGLLMPVIKSTKGPRVITVSSGAYKFGTIDFEDFDWQKREYNRGKAYGDSKLANMLFMRELQTRFDKAGIEAISLSAHPGLTSTERQQSIGVGGSFSRIMASPVETGCAPLLLASTKTDVKGQSLYGPRFFIWGAPVKQKITGLATDDKLAKKVWQYSEEILGFKFNV